MAVDPGFFGITGLAFPWVTSPDEADVLVGTDYGAGGDEFTGTLGAADVAAAVPVSADSYRLVIYSGDSYVSGERAVPTWSSDDWPSLASGSAVFIASGNGMDDVTITLALDDEGEDTQTVSLDPLTAEDTESLEGLTAYRLVATLSSGSVVTLLPRSPLSVR